MTILGFFSAPVKSDLQIMGEMINDQTRVIGNMINDQTEVLLAAASAILDNNNAQTITLTNEIRHSTREITLEMTQQMLDDMQG